MISFLMNKLGYVKKNYHLNLLEVKDTTIDMQDKSIKLLQTKLDKLKINSTDHISKLSNTIGIYKNQLNTKERIIKDFKRRVKKLVGTKHSLKEQITQLEESLNTSQNHSKSLIEAQKQLSNTKVLLSVKSLENELLRQKLEYLCFGNILPSVMRVIDYQYYMYPTQGIQRRYYMTEEGISLHAYIKEPNSN